LTRGDPEARRIAGILEREGWRWTYTGNTTILLKPWVADFGMQLDFYYYWNTTQLALETAREYGGSPDILKNNDDRIVRLVEGVAGLFNNKTNTLLGDSRIKARIIVGPWAGDGGGAVVRSMGAVIHVNTGNGTTYYTLVDAEYRINTRTLVWPPVDGEHEPTKILLASTRQIIKALTPKGETWRGKDGAVALVDPYRLLKDRIYKKTYKMVEVRAARESIEDMMRRHTVTWSGMPWKPPKGGVGSYYIDALTIYLNVMRGVDNPVEYALEHGLKVYHPPLIVVKNEFKFKFSWEWAQFTSIPRSEWSWWEAVDYRTGPILEEYLRDLPQILGQAAEAHP